MVKRSNPILLFVLLLFTVSCDKEELVCCLPPDEVKANFYSNLEKFNLSESVKEKIKNHLSENHPGIPISTVELDSRGIEIELDNEVALSFSLRGEPLDSDGSENQTNIEFAHTTIPSDINDLFEFRGDATKDTVWVFLQGGATTERDYNLNEISSSGTDRFPYFTDDFIVYPFQSQQLNPSLHDHFDLTFEQAKVEASLSVEIAQQVIKHHVDRDKTVYVIGHSYGAFMVQELLAEYGSNSARKYISLNGRLDMNEKVWKGFSMGEFYYFDEDGKTLVKSPEIPADELRFEHNMGRLNAGLGFNRYTEKLAQIDLSNALFLTAEKDQAVGVYTPETIEFLTEKNPAEKLIMIPGGHGQIFEEAPRMEKLHNFIVMDN
ncbi:MAG: hypothetical protein OXE77_00370 [Flavobacteriaceae bacterium]|nr:hypothetical protein [Flavobacteriaceae bacterium]MCY4267987.1 hypothetical protein [Flavobacteriaceae bacterium]